MPAAALRGASAWPRIFLPASVARKSLTAAESEVTEGDVPEKSNSIPKVHRFGGTASSARAFVIAVPVANVARVQPTSLLPDDVPVTEVREVPAGPAGAVVPWVPTGLEVRTLISTCQPMSMEGGWTF